MLSVDYCGTDFQSYRFKFNFLQTLVRLFCYKVVHRNERSQVQHSVLFAKVVSVVVGFGHRTY